MGKELSLIQQMSRGPLLTNRLTWRQRSCNLSPPTRLCDVSLRSTYPKYGDDVPHFMSLKQSTPCSDVHCVHHVHSGSPFADQRPVLKYCRKQCYVTTVAGCWACVEGKVVVVLVDDLRPSQPRSRLFKDTSNTTTTGPFDCILVCLIFHIHYSLVFSSPHLNLFPLFLHFFPALCVKHPGPSLTDTGPLSAEIPSLSPLCISSSIYYRSPFTYSFDSSSYFLTFHPPF
ncbi:hypothetical protein F4824DRAFT_394038 [Ustulina deusta]|nr:hypothetical protein F4824DRAFT_394038 [Ustulina deusta]